MQEKQTVHVLYKNLGETPHEAVLRFKKEHPEYADEPMTYAGRLDPMAEGLLLVLSGDVVDEKEKYLDLPKTYETEILWGFETDTLDVLGIVESRKLKVESVNEEDIKKYLKNLIGKFEQKYPAYSSKPVSGKPLFQWAREGKLDQIQIPSHQVKVVNAEYISRRSITKIELMKSIEEKVGLVSGDFRQKEILEKWKDILSKVPFDSYSIDTITMAVSSGFYVRQFVSDLAESFGVKAITFHITRVKIGDYHLK